MNDRLVLAIDTSFGPVGAALADVHGNIVASFAADNPTGTQAETLPPLVAEMFANAGVAFDRLFRIAVTVGPGAFTGVRVGLAFAKGLRLATGGDVLGFTTLECLAAQAMQDHEGNVAVVIDAKRGEVYVQVFGPGVAPLTIGALLPIEHAIESVRLGGAGVLTGSGAGLVVDAIGGARIVAIPRVDTKLLAQRAVGANPELHPPTAAYLRAPDARLPT